MLYLLLALGVGTPPSGEAYELFEPGLQVLLEALPIHFPLFRNELFELDGFRKQTPTEWFKCVLFFHVYIFNVLHAWRLLLKGKNTVMVLSLTVYDFRDDASRFEVLNLAAKLHSL